MAEFSLTSLNISEELQILTLRSTEVVRIDKKSLGSGSYGQVFAVKYGGKPMQPKKFTQYY